MGRLITALMSCALLVAPNAALCADHLVAPGDIQAQLGQAASQRELDAASVKQVLSTPAAASAARALGTPVQRLQAAIPTLSDSELRDLASRSQVLRSDPAAGYYDSHDFVMILLVVAVVVVLIDVAGR